MFYYDLFVDYLVFQSICVVGNDIVRLCLFFVKFFDGWFVDGRYCWVNQQFIKIGYWFVEGDFQCVVVNGFYVQFVWCFFVVNDFVDVNDMIILWIVGIRRSCFWIYQMLLVVYEVLGGNWFVVRLFCIFMQMEGLDFKIFIILVFCYVWDWVVIFW